MRHFLFILFLLASVAGYSQPSNYTKINARYRWMAGYFDSSLHIPMYTTTPSGTRVGSSTMAGAIALDTVNHRFYYYSNGAWNRVAKYSELASTSWGLSGNAINSGDFLGTTNAEDLLIKAGIAGNTVARFYGDGNYRSFIGRDNVPTGLYSFAVGWKDTAIGTGSFAGGTDSKALGGSSFAFGSNSKALESSTVAFGGARVEGVLSFGMGANTVTSERSAVFGENNTVSGDFSFAANSFNIASGAGAFAVGFSDTASGAVSAVFGGECIASEHYSFAQGHESRALGIASIAMGNGVTSSGYGATTFGKGYTNSKDTSFAVGFIQRKFEVSPDSVIISPAVGFKIDIPSKSNGYVLTSDANGNATWQAASNVNIYNSDGTLTGNRLVSGSNLYTLRVDSANFVSSGRYTSGATISSYSGLPVMFFYPRKGAFRAGEATSTQWDNANIGDFSGVVGVNGTASGYSSFSINGDNVSSGTASFSAGIGNKSKSYSGTVVGTYNDSTNASSSTAYNTSNRAFQIGIGSADGSRANAMTVLFNGNVGVGTTTPDSTLQVSGGFYANRGVRLTGLSSSSNATDSMLVVNVSNGKTGYRAIPSSSTVSSASGSGVSLVNGSSQIKRLKAGSEISITDNTDSVTIASEWTTVIATSDQTTSATSGTNITELLFAVSANKTYQFEADIIVSTNASTTGYGVGFTYPSGATGGCTIIQPYDNTAIGTIYQGFFSGVPNPTTSNVSASSSYAHATIRCTAYISSTSGNIQFQFHAENGSGGSATIKAGSIVKYRQLD